MATRQSKIHREIVWEQMDKKRQKKWVRSQKWEQKVPPKRWRQLSVYAFFDAWGIIYLFHKNKRNKRVKKTPQPQANSEITFGKFRKFEF